MIRIVLLICLQLAVCAVADEETIPPSEFTEAGHTTDGLDIVRERVRNKSAVLLDVRERDEWTAGHLKRAHLVPLSAVRSGELTKKMKKALKKDRPVYVHCASGGRVLLVSKMLRIQGYDIRPLRQGYAKLLDAGFTKAMPTSEKPNHLEE